jgi:hypothetical protein
VAVAVVLVPQTGGSGALGDGGQLVDQTGADDASQTGEGTGTADDTGTVDGQVGVDRAGPAEFFPVDTDCLKFDYSLGEPMYWGEEAPGLAEMGRKLEVIHAAYPYDIAGSAYCSDRQGVAIFVANLTDEIAAEIAAVAAEYPELPVVVEDAAFGCQTAMDLVSLLLDEFRPVLLGGGCEMDTGGLNISYYYHDSAEAEVARAVTAEVIHAKVLEWTGLDMPVMVRDGGGPVVLATR